jgi:hypothetical protein
MAPLAMPSMSLGDNSYTYLEHTDNRSGANAARHLRITHTWVERRKTHPPTAPESPVYPANGGRSDGTDVVFQWHAATDPDGDAITDYHFQLSDRPDMRWPMSPNFDKYVSRTADQGQTRYTLPRPGLLTHGVTYYWHVKAKNAHGVWGPWSDTWSFTAQGSGYPLDLAIKWDAGAGIGTLTWRANPAGRAPAKYRVYGSDEKGFTVHDTPYEVKLGDTKELANPFPANFVAEVAGTSLEVLGVGNGLPNANKAYYRVVAVDAGGKRSGDSDYVEAPRPFIYSTPVTSAPAGQPYRYQVKAIRSIGDLARRDGARPKPGTKFWKLEPLKFSLTQKPGWMSINPETGLITGTSDGTGGMVTVSVTLTKEHRLVHDENAIVWGNEYEKSKTYETLGPVTQQFVCSGAGLPSASTQAAETWTDVSSPLLASLTNSGAALAWPGGCSGVVANRLTGEVAIKVVGGGLWRSPGQGMTWQRIDDGCVSGRDETGWATSVDQDRPTRMASFSLDGSAGWTTDGRNWTRFTSLGRNWDFGSVDWAADVPRTIIAAKHETDPPGEVYVSTDGGIAWRKLAIHLNANRERISMVGALAGGTFIYSRGEGIERSTDGGATWTRVSSVNPQTRIPVLFHGAHYLGTESGLLVSQDQGASWQAQGGAVNIWLGPFFGHDESEMVVVGREGAFLTKNGGQTWTRLAGLKPKEGNYTFGPNWFGCYAWDPVGRFLYASAMGNAVYRVAL